MKGLLLTSVVLMSLSAFSQTTQEVSAITKTPVMNLGAVDEPVAELADITINADGSIRSAKLEISANLKPRGCDLFFLEGDILAQFKNETKSELNTVQTITFGSVHDIGVASACSGVSPRPAKIKVSIINGQGAAFDKDRTITIRVKANDSIGSSEVGFWNILIQTNQAKGNLRIDSIKYDIDL